LCSNVVKDANFSDASLKKAIITKEQADEMAKQSAVQQTWQPSLKNKSHTAEHLKKGARDVLHGAKIAKNAAVSVHEFCIGGPAQPTGPQMDAPAIVKKRTDISKRKTQGAERAPFCYAEKLCIVPDKKREFCFFRHIINTRCYTRKNAEEKKG